MSLEFEAIGTRDQYARCERVDAYGQYNNGLTTAGLWSRVWRSKFVSLSLSPLVGEVLRASVHGSGPPGSRNL